MEKRKFKALSLCSMILLCLPIIVLIIFFFSPDLIEKFIIEKEFIGTLGVILLALKGVAKLYAKVSKNRSPAYKKIVPKERVGWIHDLKAYLAELMGIMEESDGRLKDLDEVAFKKDMRRAKELYFKA